MNVSRLAACVVCALISTACTKPVTGDATAPADSPASAMASRELPAASKVLLYNAYASDTLADGGVAGEPRNTFRANDKIYVGAVLHGKSASSEIKVEWSKAGGTPVESESISIPVTEASVATVEITKQGMLAPGQYKVLVYLDGAPSWELQLTISP